MPVTVVCQRFCSGTDGEREPVRQPDTQVHLEDRR